jgi:1,4-dihydroxy-2-naphthoate octaprenyltransferase
MSEMKHILGPMRLPFLILTPACVLLGLGTAVWTSDGVNYIHFVLALIGGIAAHIAVNSFNEYWDFKSGLDLRTQRTPFSGGSGTLPAKPELARQALTTAIFAVVIICAIGLYFLSVRGLSLMPLGVAGIVVVVVYTRYLTTNPVLCLVAPGLGFGTFMVMGTDFVLTGEYTKTAFVASCIPFFLVNNLLLLNQFPDVDADRSVGRKHFPIVIGRKASAVIYGAFNALAYLSIVLGVKLGLLPKACLLALATLVLAVPASLGAVRHCENVERLIPFMVMNVLVNIVTPVLAAVGLFVG